MTQTSPTSTMATLGPRANPDINVFVFCHQCCPSVVTSCPCVVLSVLLVVISVVLALSSTADRLQNALNVSDVAVVVPRDLARTPGTSTTAVVELKMAF